MLGRLIARLAACGRGRTVWQRSGGSIALIHSYRLFNSIVWHGCDTGFQKFITRGLIE